MLAMLGTLRRFSIAEHDAATAPVIRNRCNYPSAGALDELEYFWVHDGSGQLRAGVYHFNKSHLSLEEVSVDQEAVDVLLKRAMLTWGKENGRPRGLIVITADYIKVASKYQNIAYRLSLLNAGVALQSIYLAASLANIGVCALGTGDSLEFSRVSRVRESSHFALCEIAVAGAL
ncbi:SagB family peptide dehydrogenase [Caballeronia arationis]|uniref:SagB family peptide dehydrogenase n=1 Tax=Caballeronia arationis TaxID=1777142 RepID=UPI00135733B7|nr:SagB family peptide dehydrogenase [Caballeronia arationis]